MLTPSIAAYTKNVTVLSNMSVLKKQISRTFVRSDAMMDKYIASIKARAKMENPPNPFEDIESIALKKFKHWVIIPNDFPYDAIATTNHLLFTRRKVAFSWDLLTKDEIDELNHLKKTYIADNYDAIWENLPSGQTVPGHFHLQLLILKREDVTY